MKVPAVSVVMPIHNGRAYLAESIGSIVTQTLTDIEIVVLDDASDDGTADLLHEWARRDDRLRLVRSAERLGVVGSANRVVREARAPICARMDADDVSHRDRLRRQLAVLSARPDVALVGTLWEGIDSQGRRVRRRDRWQLLRRSGTAPFPHGSIMFRRDAFVTIGGYREACVFWEDLDLYTRISRGGRVLVIPQALYRYRFHRDSTRLSAPPEALGAAIELRRQCVALLRRGHDYSCLLAGPGASPGRGEGASPQTLFAIGWGRLWAGHRPGLLKELVGRRAWPRSAPTCKAWLLALWGALSPSTLRSLLAALVGIRDRLAGWVLDEEAPVEWRFE